TPNTLSTYSAESVTSAGRARRGRRAAGAYSSVREDREPDRSEAMPSAVAFGDLSEFMAFARIDELHRVDTLVHSGLVQLALELDPQSQLVLRIGVADGLFVADVALFVVVEQRLVEGLHAELGGLGHDLLDLGDLALEDQVRDQGRVEQDLQRRHAALAVRLLDEALGDDALDVEREVHQQLMAALFREQVDDAVQGLVGAVGMQGREAEVAGLGELHRVLHGLAVADLTDQDHVRRLAQGVLEGDLPVVRVHAHFALGDE